MLAWALLALPVAPAAAQVFKCVDDKTGQVSFSDTRCDTRSSGGRVQVKPNTLDTSGSREQISRRQARERQDQGDAEGGFGPFAARSSLECEQAKREYENEAGSIYRDPGVTQARRRYMEVACGTVPQGVPPAASVDAARFGSSECQQARREYENEAASIAADPATTEKRRIAMIDACGMNAEWYQRGRVRSVEPARAPQAAPVAPVLPAASATSGSVGKPAPVSSCDAGGCWDVAGQRYHGTGPVYFPANGGQPCRLIGELMHCP